MKKAFSFAMLVLVSFLVINLDCGEMAIGAPTIKVGLLGSRSGKNATYGEALIGPEFVFKQINEAGGIKSLGGARIEWVYGDTASDPAKEGGEIERLVEVEKVKGIINSSITAEVLAGVEVFERLKIPMVTTTTTGAPLIPLNLKYWIMIAVRADVYGASTVVALNDLVKDYRVKCDRIVLVTADAPSTLAYRDGVLEELKRTVLDRKLVDDIKYSTKADLESMSSIILRVKARNPDALILLSTLGDYAVVYKAMNAVGYQPPMIFNGTVELVTEKAWTVLGESLMSKMVVNKSVSSTMLVHPKMPYKIYQEFLSKFQPFIKGREIMLTDYMIPCAQAAYVFIKAWETAGTTDPVVVNKTIHEMEIKEGDPYLMNPMFLPALKFRANGEVIHSCVYQAQWKDRNTVIIISPKRLKMGEPNLPK